jgi:hypothetical protein
VAVVLRICGDSKKKMLRKRVGREKSRPFLQKIGILEFGALDLHK